MKTAQLHETIKKAGPKLFVHHFDLIANPVLPVEALADRILLTKKYDRADLLNRLYHARRICKANAARDALRIISDHKKITDEYRSRARQLYRNAAIPKAKDFQSPPQPAPPYNVQIAGRYAPLNWYRAPDGLLCADVHSELAGAVTLVVQPTADAWTARAVGFLAVVFHALDADTEADAVEQIAIWWGEVGA